MSHDMAQERRRRRSDDTTEALGYWLEALSAARGARAAAIGTWDGLPIATAGRVDDPLMLAAAGSLAADGQVHAAKRFVPDVDAQPVDVFGDNELVLTLCGAAAPTDDDVGQHIRRILS